MCTFKEFMSKVPKAIDDIHLYNDKGEYLIRLILWLFSWGGGVYACERVQTSVGSVYLFFSVSLLTEFIPIISRSGDRNRLLLSRLIRTLFLFLLVVMALLSFIVFFGDEYNTQVHSWLKSLTITSLAFMGLDCFLLYVFKTDVDSADITVPQYQELAEANDVLIRIFWQRLNEGNLGNPSEVK